MLLFFSDLAWKKIVFLICDFKTRHGPTTPAHSGQLSKSCYNILIATTISLLFQFLTKHFLSLDVASGSKVTSYNKIDKPLVVYRFSGNFMTSITTMRTK